MYYIIAIRSYEKIEYSEKECEFGPILIKDKENLPYFRNILKSIEDIYYRSHSEDSKKTLDYKTGVILLLSSYFSMFSIPFCSAFGFTSHTYILILKEQIKDVLKTLQKREQEVLELRFGLLDGTC